MAVALHQGYKYGLPAYHAVTGSGMPVLTPSLWVPPKGAEEAAGPSAKDHVTGNLPVETPHLHVDGGKLRDPAWIKLIDPTTREPFWFHKRFRSRRETEPDGSDDGREGAGAGEPGAKRFMRCVDPETGYSFFADLIAHTTSWQEPEDFGVVGATQPGAEAAASHPDAATAALPSFPPVLMLGRQFYDGRWWGQKRGGGGGLFASRAFRRRLFVVDDGRLQYYKSEQAEADNTPQATVPIDLDNYIPQYESGGTDLELQPVKERTEAAAGAGSPSPSRSFVLRLDDAASAQDMAPRGA